MGVEVDVLQVQQERLGNLEPKHKFLAHKIRGLVLSFYLHDFL